MRLNRSSCWLSTEATRPDCFKAVRVCEAYDLGISVLAFRGYRQGWLQWNRLEVVIMAGVEKELGFLVFSANGVSEPTWTIVLNPVIIYTDLVSLGWISLACIAPNEF